MKPITAKFSGAKVLVADDYPINLDMTKEMLKMMGCNVDTAEDGAQVVDMHLKNNYDIIFMDVQMPELDGYAATAKIREMDSDKKDIPIIAITANALSGDRQKCIDAGMNDYISKPIKGENLEEMLRKYLKR